MVSTDKLDSLDDESGDDGSYSRSAVTCSFPFRFEDSVGRFDDYVGRIENSIGRVPGMEYGVFVTTVIESTGDVVTFVMFVPKGVSLNYFGVQSIDFPS